MSKQFVCTIDSKSFNTQEELVSHLIQNYSMEDTTNGKKSEVLRQLKDAFPFANIEVTDNLDKREKPYGDYKVSMNWEDFNAHFDFYIGEAKEFAYYDSQFVNLEAAITCYSRFVECKELVTQSLQKLYSPELIEIEQMYDGDSDSSPGILFIVKKDGKSVSQHCNPFANPDEIARSFGGYFEKSFEGEVTTESVCHVYERGYYVNNVSVDSILARAKKVKIEILELNDKS